MKKRVLSLTLVVLLVLSLLPPAFAAEDVTYFGNEAMLALLPDQPTPVEKPQSFHQAIFSCMILDTIEIVDTQEAVFQNILRTTEDVIRGKTSETEKAKAIYQWVAQNIKYDYEAAYDEVIAGGHDPFSTFDSRKGVCEGYALLSCLMLSIAELPSAYISGTAKNGGLHGWTAVYADGRWLMFDATWGEWNIDCNYHDNIESITTRDGTVCKRYWNNGRSDFLYDTKDGGEIVIGEEIDWIDFDVFCYYANPFSVTMKTQVKITGGQAFKNCRNLVKITLPESVTAIKSETFYGCTALKQIYIPESVTEIGTYAFKDCTALTDVYYGGSAEQWNGIEIKKGNDLLTSADIHYHSAMPDSSVTPVASAVSTAYASTQNVLVDGKSVEFQCYALKDIHGGDTNYIKLRDIAYILNGTAAQFNVGWDGNVNIETGKAYVSNGSEMSTPFSGNRAYENANAPTFVDGKLAALDAIVLTDDNGGAYTYYKLRDLGSALGFTVDWSSEQGIFIETR